MAHVFSEQPSRMLQRLVDIAVEYCGADSSGISLEEMGPDGRACFRWIVVAGSFAKYLNGRTPRDFSPCGTCLDRGQPQLYRVTQQYYDFLGVTAATIHDEMLIPWNAGHARGTIWAVSHAEGDTFAPADYELLNSLADFAEIAMRLQSREELVRERDRAAASAARAHEMAHEINNPLQSLTNTLFLARGTNENAEYLAQAAEELAALSSLVRRMLRPEEAVAKGVA